MKFVSEHRLRNDPAEARQLAGWVQDFVRHANLPDAVGKAIDLALEECVTNVFAYGWNDGHEHAVLIRFKADSDQGNAQVEIEDDGREFNPLTAPPVDLAQPLERRPVGGLGVHMVRQIMDEVAYRREEGRNILTLTKRTGPVRRD
jgi:anti-sigma regulatory factor (Ser/Thr protein kinase)